MLGLDYFHLRDPFTFSSVLPVFPEANAVFVHALRCPQRYTLKRRIQRKHESLHDTAL